jgi:uncharacterized membrane protein YgcG
MPLRATFRKSISRHAEMRGLLALAIGLILAVATPAVAAERITSFVSDVTVNADASLSVRETISVAAEGQQIKRGIFRDFPTSYQDRMGQRVNVDFTVVAVRRDGKPEPYALEALSNGTRIRIGDRDVLLEPGLHRYEIAYQTTRQIGFFDGFDELYWNVTGNGWTLPIGEARAIIRLPEGAEISRQAVYTGPDGSTAANARIISVGGNLFDALTTRTLEPYQGFTVAVGWQKGIVTAPSNGQRWTWWITDNSGFFVLALGLVVSGLYFLFAWSRVGRDPAKGTIIPLFTPPKGLGPACARFLRQFSADDRAFAAALVGLAVKGRLRIAEDDGDFTITKLTDVGSREPLTASEKALFNALPAGSTALTQANQKKVAAAKSALESALADEYVGTAFLRNLGWFAAGLGLSILFLAAAALLLAKVRSIDSLFPLILLGGWWAVILSVGWASLKGIAAARGLWGKMSSLAALLFLIPFVGAGAILPLSSMFSSGGLPAALYVLAGGAALFGIINVIFYRLLQAPTESGQRLRDQIEGFHLYLSTAEEERLKILHPPEKTPQLFERYLPYALALDCENEWNAKFATVLAAAAAAGAAAPLWYSGNHWNPGHNNDFTDSLGEALATSAAAAATPPGRSSGSGGGGFSGGGGGGGGGGGW